MPQQYRPSTALVVVDMQVDFADPAGSLYVRGAEEIVVGVAADIDAARAAGATVVFTQDWHPSVTPHFAKDGGLWPVHCVIDSPGADFVPGLMTDGSSPLDGPDFLVRKGSGPEDGYSAFSVLDLQTRQTRGTELSVVLDENGIMDIVVIGLAGDWCVKETAVDGIRLGYGVTVPLTLTRFVELRPGDGEAAVRAMREAGVHLEDDVHLEDAVQLEDDGSAG